MARVYPVRTITIKCFSDNCYAVVKGKRRGPVGPDIPRALKRFRRAGLIASAATDKRG